MKKAVTTPWRERETATLEETAEILGISRNTAYVGASEGDIPTIRVRNRKIVPTAWLKAQLSPVRRTRP